MSDVSVVIPTYNRATLLERTLVSILAQSVPPREIIVVDDGSTDETAAVCERQAATVRRVWQENAGLSAARNRGLREASGEWIALCDSDDLWHPRKLEIQLACMSAMGAEWSATACRLIDPQGRALDGGTGFERVFPIFAESGTDAAAHFARWLPRRTVSVSGTPVTVYTGDAFGMLFEGNVVLPSSTVLARSLVQRVGFFDESFRSAEETEYFHRVAAIAPVAIVMEPLVDYRVGHASIINGGDSAPTILGALESGRRAAELRPLSKAERAAHERGRRRLWARLAYVRLSNLDRSGVRDAILRGWREERVVSPKAVGCLLASFLPEALLRGAHRAKRVASSGQG